MSFFKVLLLLTILINVMHAKDKILKIAVVKDFTPYSFYSNNEISGFLIDYWKLWAKKNDKKIKFIPMSLEKSIEALKNNKVDFHAGLIIPNKLSSQIDYIKTIYPLELNLYTKNTTSYINSKNLDNKNLVSLETSFTKSNIKEVFTKSNLLIEKNIEDIFNNMDNKRSDFFLAERNEAWYALIKYSEFNNYKKVKDFKIKKWFFAGVKKGNTKIKEEVLKGMYKITNDDFIRLEKKWIHDLSLRHFKNKIIFFNNKELEYIKNKKNITFTEINWKPISIIENNKLKGLYKDYFKIVEKRTGLKFIYLPSTNWPKSIEKFKNKQIDILPIVRTKQLYDYDKYEKIGKVSSAFTDFNYSIVTTKDKPYIDELRDLSFKTLALPKAYTSYNLIKKFYPNINIIETKNIKEAMKLVQNNKAYAFLGHTAVSSYYINNFFPSLKLAGFTSFRFSHHFLIQNDSKVLLSIINKVLNTITYEQKQRIRHKWIATNVESPINYKLIYNVVLVFLFLLFVIVFFNYRLKKSVRKKTRELKTLLSSFDKNVIACKINQKKEFVYVSEAFCALTQYTAEELLNKNYNILKYKENNIVTMKGFWEIIFQHRVWKGEIINIKKDNSSFCTSSVVTAEYDDKNNFLYYTQVSQDITSSKEVYQAKKEIEFLNNEILDTQKEVVFRMGAIAEVRSKETGFHVKRVAEYSKLFALYSNLSKDDAELLKQASPMHDIGKVAIADNILNKPGKLTKDEFEIMKTHASIGYEMLNLSDKNILKVAAIVAHEHHEKFDGSGYPRGIKGEDIHIYGRITALADVFDALGSQRCYKEAWSDKKIFEFFKKEKGKHFDPALVDIFFEHLDEFITIRNTFVD